MSLPWLCIQHVAWEGPGTIAEEAAKCGIALEERRMDKGKKVPAPKDLPSFGGLIVMGGPMSANDTKQYPHFEAERKLLAEAVNRHLPVLGVCLGAQLLASALGSRIYPGPSSELGFGTVELTQTALADPIIGTHSPLPVFHWHEETFELPQGATLLASTSLFPHQAFRAGSLAYGLQFHLELCDPLLHTWREHLPPHLPLPPSKCQKVEKRGREIFHRFFQATLEK